MANFYRRFLTAYVIILVITLISFLFLYTQSALIIEDSIVNSRLTNLRMISAELDNSLADIVHSVSMVANDSQVRSLMHISAPYDGPNIIRVMETKAALRTLYVSSPMLADIFIVYDYNDIVISSRVAWRTAAFYGLHFSIAGMDYSGWRYFTFGANHHARFVPAMDIRLGVVSLEAMQLISPIRAPHGNRGAVVSLIDTNAIHGLFAGIDMAQSDGSISYIISPEGSILSFTGAPLNYISDFPMPTGAEGTIKFEHNGASYLMSYIYSGLFGLTYVSVIGSGYVLAGLNSFRSMVIIIILITLFVTVAFSFVYAAHQARPIKKLQDTVDAQMPILLHSFMADMFEGKLLKDSDTTNAAASLGIDIAGDRYMAVALSGNSGPIEVHDLAKLRMFVESFTESHFNPHIKLSSVSLSGNVLAVLLIDDGNELEEYVIEFSNYLAENMGASGINGVSIGIGGIYAHPTDVYKSFSGAVEAIEYHLILDCTSPICYFADIPHNSEFYFYPEEEEKRLLNMVRNGNTEEVRAALNDICRENFINRQLSHNMMTAFINHLCQGLFKIDRIGITGEEYLKKTSKFCEEIYQLTDIEKLTHCTQLYTTLTDGIREQKHNKIHNIIVEIVAMCKENYHDPDISLVGLAMRYKLSETYLSAHFKEYTGETFYSYLQNIRIDRAIELLTSSQLSIYEISESVGYSSYNTFSKAFKRKTGINAGDYRKSRRE